MAGLSSGNRRLPLQWRFILLKWSLSLVWFSLIFGLAVSTYGSWLTLTRGTNVNTLNLGDVWAWIVQYWFIIVPLFLVLLALTFYVVRESLLDEDSSYHSGLMEQVQQSRKPFLAALLSRYTEDMQQSLQGAELRKLGLHLKPDAIYYPSSRVVPRHTAQLDQPLEPGTSILEVYDKAVGELLVLGEPGVGKTTLLLELGCGLLERAVQDETHPIPVMFHLSSWGVKQGPLDEWLVEELMDNYLRSRPLSEVWVQTNRLLLLLDGLDQVTDSARSACIDAINTYRQEHDVSVVVCCRGNAYQSQPNRLVLKSAVEIQPLTKEQVMAYLEARGPLAAILEALHLNSGPLAAIREALLQNPELYKVITTPFMLNVVTLTYQGKRVEDLPHMGSVEEQQRLIFTSYVERAFEHREPDPRYSQQQTKHWLTWLAQHMRQRKSVFYIEQMQPEWLLDEHGQRIYEYLAVKLPGVLIGMLISIVINTLLFIDVDATNLIQFGLIGGLLGGLLSHGGILRQPASEQRSKWKQVEHWLITRASIGLCIGFAMALSLGPRLEAVGWGEEGYYAGLMYGIIFSVGSVLLSACVSGRSNMGKHTVRLQTMPTRGVRKSVGGRLVTEGHLRNGLLIGVLCGLSFGLSSMLNHGGLPDGLGSVFRSGLSYGLSGIIMSVMLVRRTGTISPAEIITWSWHRLGRSLVMVSHLINALFFGLSSALSIGLAVGLPSGLVFGVSFGLSAGLRLGLILGVSRGVAFGLTLGLGYWLLLGLFQSIASDTFVEDQRMIPNQGISQSLSNGVYLGIIIGVISQLVSFLGTGLNLGLQVLLSSKWAYGLSNDLSFGLSQGLYVGNIVGIASGLLAFLLNGGLAWWQHWVLRFMLWRSGSVPWNYSSFLDDAAARILLHKVGGGYRFTHDLFLDYIASLSDATTSSPSS